MPVTRTDFYDVLSLLNSLADQLGQPVNSDGDVEPIEVLRDKCADGLKRYPSFLVVDDVDSLELANQQERNYSRLCGVVTRV